MLVLCDQRDDIAAFITSIGHQCGVLAQTGKAAHLMHCVVGANFASARSRTIWVFGAIRTIR
jgi:hypothetical protein